MPTENAREVLSDGAYKALVSSVDKLLKESEKAGKDADSGKAVTYWRVGDALVAAGLIGRDHYGGSVIEQMAEELEINAQTLRRAIVFRRVYDRENLYRSVQHLTYSHYRQLIEIHDDAARRYYEDRAVKEEWSRDRMKAAIAGRDYEREALKEDEGPAILKRPTDAAYVFKATVLEVVDADTLTVDLDCGFLIKKRETIRLAALNAPEKETKKGKEAMVYVRDRLVKARGVAVKTNKSDAFGRYLGHVFYSFEEEKVGEVYTEGVYLNEELLKKGMAERM